LILYVFQEKETQKITHFLKVIGVPSTYAMLITGLAIFARKPYADWLFSVFGYPNYQVVYCFTITALMSILNSLFSSGLTKWKVEDEFKYRKISIIYDAMLNNYIGIFLGPLMNSPLNGWKFSYLLVNAMLESFNVQTFYISIGISRLQHILQKIKGGKDQKPWVTPVRQYHDMVKSGRRVRLLILYSMKLLVLAVSQQWQDSCLGFAKNCDLTIDDPTKITIVKVLIFIACDVVVALMAYAINRSNGFRYYIPLQKVTGRSIIEDFFIMQLNIYGIEFYLKSMIIRFK